MAHVVLLRGVNVGGHRTFRPSRLVERMKTLDVVNIGAAGTFVVRASTTRTRLRAEFARRLPFETEIVLCESREIARILARGPFGDEPARPDIVRFVSVMARRPRSVPPVPMRVPAEGEWLLRILAIDGRFVTGVYRRRMKAIRHLDSMDRIFGVPVTTRNWNTMTAILDVSRSESRAR